MDNKVLHLLQNAEDANARRAASRDAWKCWRSEHAIGPNKPCPPKIAMSPQIPGSSWQVASDAGSIPKCEGVEDRV